MTSALNSVGTASPTVLQHRMNWSLVDTLWGGTTTMRLAGRALLPQEEKETDPQYAARLSRSTLDNFYREGVERAADKVFSQDIDITDLGPELTMWWDDVDTQGRDGNQFAREVFLSAVNHGVSYILTDYARAPQDEPFRNRAEELAANLRPYWVNIKAPTVLAADSERIAGQERLACFRFMETIYELGDDGITVESYVQVRSFHQREVGGLAGPVEFRVYREDEGQYELVDSGILPSFVTAIPVVAVYGRRTGFCLGEPVLLPLAELNVQHWRKRSDLENVLHIANVPFLFGKGFGSQVDTSTGGKAKDLVISIHQAMVTANKDADIKWVEHTGSAIKSAAEDIANMENRMRDLSSTLYSTSSVSGKSATESAINSAEANARLKSLALSLQDALEYALFFVNAYLQLPPMTDNIEVNTSFATDYVAQDTFMGVLTLYKMGLIGQDVVIAEAKRRNIIALEQDIVTPLAPNLGKSSDAEVIPPVVTTNSEGDKTITVDT